jgi:ABC-2 type transport system ATP-binding protein
MIHIENLSKSFGKKQLFQNIHLDLKQGQTHALLGKNGAGKTSLIHLILDLIQADKGSVKILGKVNTELDEKDKAKWGVVGEDLALMEELNGKDYLKFIAQIYRIPSTIYQQRINDLCNYFFEDSAELNKAIATYSTGMKKKIAFCAAVLHAPDILILDEPFSGLDPMVANQMLAFLSKYQNEDRLIFVSSHDLTYVEKIASHITVIDQGTIRFSSTLQDFTENGEKSLDAALVSLLKPNNNELSKMEWL